MNKQFEIEKINQLLNNATPDVYQSGGGAVVYIYQDKTVSDYHSVLDYCKVSEYKFVADCEIDNNVSTTFLSEGYILHIYYCLHEKILRIVTDKDSVLPDYIKPSTMGDCPNRFWQFEVDHSLIDCGMCYLFQFSDYSFFVIDSAHIYSVNDDIRLYDFMRERTPENMPVTVSGWFFTHGHMDHIGKFMDVLRYNSDIKIERLYFNFVPDTHFSHEYWDISDRNHTNLFLDLVKQSEIPVINLHSLQSFYIKELQVNVLCTHEDVYPCGLENYNDSSTVVMLTVNGDKILIPGDAGGEESKICENRFPFYLKCDILQEAHHGHFGTSENFYRLANARYLLCPSTLIKYNEEFLRYKANQVASQLAQEVFIASDGTVEFCFPLNKNEPKRLPDETVENFDGIFSLWSYTYTDEFKTEIYERYRKYSNSQR